MELKRLQKIDDEGKKGNLRISYNEVVKKIFEPNVTHLDDIKKVAASWAIVDEKGRESFIWAWKFYGNIKDCKTFSISGNIDLLNEIFNHDIGLIDTINYTVNN